MKGRIAKLTVVFAAGIMLLGVLGCGAKYPTTAEGSSQDDQQKLTVTSEIVTEADVNELAAD